MLTYLLIGLAILVVLVAPFIPGWIELARGTDSKPLNINMDYTRSAFFFGDQFEALLHGGLFPAGTSPVLEQKEYTVTLSRPEKVSVITAPSWTYAPFSRTKTIVYAEGNLEAGESASFSKELSVAGNASLGNQARLRAILCKGRVTLENGVKITRWVDARQGITAGADCNLGRNAATQGPLSLGPGCTFGSLYGLPIQTAKAEAKALPVAEGNIREKALVVTSLLFSIPAHSELHNDIVASQDLKICSGSVIYGNIKGSRDVELEDNVTVHGTVVANESIIIGANCRILGNVFAQQNVQMGHGVTVGEEGRIKSVISRSTITLSPSVTVYGYIACEKGQTAKE